MDWISKAALVPIIEQGSKQWRKGKRKEAWAGGGAGRGIPTHGTLRASLVATVHIRTKKYKSQSAGMSIKG